MLAPTTCLRGADPWIPGCRQLRLPPPPPPAPYDSRRISHPHPHKQTDFLTQYFNRDKRQPYRHDFRKTAAMAAAGAAVAAPVGIGMYAWMDAAWPSSAAAVAAGKFTLDQIVGCAIWQVRRRGSRCGTVAAAVVCARRRQSAPGPLGETQ